MCAVDQKHRVFLQHFKAPRPVQSGKSFPDRLSRDQPSALTEQIRGISTTMLFP